MKERCDFKEVEPEIGHHYSISTVVKDCPAALHRSDYYDRWYRWFFNRCVIGNYLLNI